MSKCKLCFFSMLTVILGCLVFVNAIIATVMSNLSTGLFMTYGLALLLIGCGIWYRHLPRWCIVFVLSVLCVAAAAVLTLFLVGSHDTVTYKEEIVVVLGAGIRGEIPTDSLRNRLEQTVLYHKKNPDALIVCSGGQGPQETITEATAMERWLVEHGVPASSIIKEESAASTAENFRFTRALLDNRSNGDCTLAFITTDYHILRACAAANAVGFDNAAHLHSDTPWYMVIPNGLRECTAILIYFLLG